MTRNTTFFFKKIYILRAANFKIPASFQNEKAYVTKFLTANIKIQAHNYLYTSRNCFQLQARYQLINVYMIISEHVTEMYGISMESF